MPLRDKVKRAFHRSSSNSKPNANGNGVKIEYYKRHEIPRPKFRGPFDPEHQKRLAAWNFQSAQEDRPRSPDLSLSPRATLDLLSPQTSDSNESREQSDEPSEIFDNSPTVTHDEFANAGSLSSTAVDSNCGASVLALPLDAGNDRADSIARLKESIRHPSPVRAESAQPKTKQMPFAPEDLSRALDAAQI